MAVLPKPRAPDAHLSLLAHIIFRPSRISPIALAFARSAEQLFDHGRRLGPSHLPRMAHDDPIPALKRQLAAELKPRVDGWRSADIAGLLRTDRARISDLRRGKLDRFSLETLIRFAHRARCDVALTVVERRFDGRRK